MAVAKERLPALSAAIQGLIDHRLAEVHTCLPGRITKYDKDTQIANVKVCVKRRTPTDDGNTIVEDFPIIPNVPVDVEQSANFFMSFPIDVGDFVWLHIIEQSVDKFRKLGDVQTTSDADPIDRRFNLTDCYATLARNPKAPITATDSDAIVLGHKSTGPRAYFTDSIIGLGAKAPSSFVALATSVTNALEAIKATLTGGITTVSGGAGSFTVPLVISTGVAATKVKAV